MRETSVKEYDAIVIGTGRGLSVIRSAVRQGLKVAVVEMGPPGGTCLNVGCIPSKFLISAADRMMEIEEAGRLGIRARVERLDFKAIMDAMRSYVSKYREERREFLRTEDSIGCFPSRGEFTGPYTLRAGEHNIKSDLVFIATGARPAIPPIEGIDKTEYHTNETVLGLDFPPKSMIIIGGGYISVEYGHFFSAMGTRVTLVEIKERLIQREEPEIAGLLKERLSERMEVHTGTEPIRVASRGGEYTLTCKCEEEPREVTLTAEALMVATGRAPNSDLLSLDATGVETDERGFIEVDEFFRTSKDGIWAFGDAIGKGMFTHAGSKEAAMAWANAHRGEKNRLDYLSVPHAIFTRPQIGSVGMTETDAAEEHDILVGRAYYKDIVKGAALREDRTFAKVIAEAGTRRLLGFHIIGPYAPMLIQEATNTLTGRGTVDNLTEGMHIHPAMSELIPAAVRSLDKPE
jgi:dihydrolipoamide dehydrogenase